MKVWFYENNGDGHALHSNYITMSALPNVGETVALEGVRYEVVQRVWLVYPNGEAAADVALKKTGRGPTVKKTKERKKP